MITTHRIEGNVCILSIEGSLVHTSNSNFEPTIDTIVESEDVSHLIIDFKLTDIVDSSGIGILLWIYKVCKNFDIAIHFCNANRAIKSVLDITNLSTIVSSCANVEEIINKYKS